MYKLFPKHERQYYSMDEVRDKFDGKFVFFVNTEFENGKFSRGKVAVVGDKPFEGFDTGLYQRLEKRENVPLSFVTTDSTKSPDVRVALYDTSVFQEKINNVKYINDFYSHGEYFETANESVYRYEPEYRNEMVLLFMSQYLAIDVDKCINGIIPILVFDNGVEFSFDNLEEASILFKLGHPDKKYMMITNSERTLLACSNGVMNVMDYKVLLQQRHRQS